jgi:hypothetical protein
MDVSIEHDISRIKAMDRVPAGTLYRLDQVAMSVCRGGTVRGVTVNHLREERLIERRLRIALAPVSIFPEVVRCFAAVFGLDQK